MCFVQQEESVEVVIRKQTPSAEFFRREEIVAKTTNAQEDINPKRSFEEQEKVKNRIKGTFRPEKCITNLFNAKAEITAIEDAVETGRPIQDKIKPEIGLLDLPIELLEEVASYLSYKEAMLIRQVNHHFYSLITGYEQVG